MSNRFDRFVMFMAVFLMTTLIVVLEYNSYGRMHKIYDLKTEYVEPMVPEPIKYDYPVYDPMVQYYVNWHKPTSIVYDTITMVDTEYEYLGYYYLTAYSPQETGSWATASGATLHRADYEKRLTEPTTCAIDRNLHRFGDLFYIPDFDRVFVAEDTGGAVRGKHLDLGYTDLESVWSFPTGYYEVYSIYYTYTDVDVEYYDFDKETGVMRMVYLHHRYSAPHE